MKYITKFSVQNISFGEITLTKNEEYFYEILNSSIPFLCKSLPTHMQNQAMIFLLNYSHTEIGKPADFFKNFYKPIWTIIPAMAESGAAVRELSEPEYKTAISGQAMALFLHSLDDHLNDGEIPSSHLLLLLRSQGWLLFNKAIGEFAEGKDELELAHSLINEYYKGMYPDKEPCTLDEYCDRFKNEMSTVDIMPMLSAKKIFKNADSIYEIKNAMEHFGVAWRILDDIQDMEEDIASGMHTAVYLSMPEEAKKMWDAAAENNADENNVNDIHEEIFRELSRGKIIEGLAARIVGELGQAGKTAKALGMHGLAEQYRMLGEPIKK